MPRITPCPKLRQFRAGGRATARRGMDWIVPVSAGEREQGCLRPETEQAALSLLRARGCVILRGVFDPVDIDRLAAEFAARYGGFDAGAMKALAARPPPNPLLEVGVGRFEITVA